MDINNVEKVVLKVNLKGAAGAKYTKGSVLRPPFNKEIMAEIMDVLKKGRGTLELVMKEEVKTPDNTSSERDPENQVVVKKEPENTAKSKSVGDQEWITMKFPQFKEYVLEHPEEMKGNQKARDKWTRTSQGSPWPYEKEAKTE